MRRFGFAWTPIAIDFAGHETQNKGLARASVLIFAARSFGISNKLQLYGAGTKVYREEIEGLQTRIFRAQTPERVFSTQDLRTIAKEIELLTHIAELDLRIPAPHFAAFERKIQAHFDRF